MSTALITGASRGIGRATAEKFLYEGWHVIGTSTSGTSPIQHKNFKAASLNLLEEKGIQKFADSIVATKNPVNVLVNNAGISVKSDGAKFIAIDALRKTLEVNLIGLIDLTERLLPLIPKGGHVINISSGLASLTEKSDAYAPAYSISKTALNMYTRVLAARLRERGVTVSSFDPGWVRTDMGGSGAPRDPKEPAAEIFHLATSNVATGYFWNGTKKRTW